MMPNRRTCLASVGAALAAVTAGCGVILGKEPATFEARPTAVDDDVLARTGYEFVGYERRDMTREYSAGGQTRRVVATNVRAKYERTVHVDDLGEVPAAVFTAVTTPQVDIFGETFNPAEDMPAGELAERAQDQYEGFENVQKQSESDITVNDESTTRGRFTADATVDERVVTTHLHVTEAVTLGRDYLITFANYPRFISEELERALALMRAVDAAYSSSPTPSQSAHGETDSPTTPAEQRPE